MDYMQWAKEMLENKTAQKLLEEKVEILIKMYFDENNEYAVEKMIKSFGESIKFQEILALKKRGIHSSQIQKNMIEISMNPQETSNKYKEVENILISEIERQYRHFITFLSAVRDNSNHKK